MNLLIAGGDVEVRVAGDHVVAVGERLARRTGEESLEATGGTVIPGLHDHHLHLHALAAARASVRLDTVRPLAIQLREAAPRPDGWVRAVGYHESMAGLLDAAALDAVVADRPVRVQHRGGSLWILNTAALQAVDAAHQSHVGIERDAHGRPTGRLWRADDWLRRLLPAAEADLTAVGRELASLGVTGATDADPERAPGSLDHLRALPQRVHVMGPLGLAVGDGNRLTVGPVKVLLDDTALPGLDELTTVVTAAHDSGRPIAVHCVTRAQLLLTLAALDAGGTVPGDRIEHASVVPTESIADIRRLGAVVVTQPNFVTERGDEYLAAVEPDDIPHLYRCATLLAAGIPVAAGTDAPFGRPDPWAAMRAAVHRRAASGAALGAGEAVPPRRALELFLGRPSAPAAPRVLAPGRPADLCVLRAPLRAALNELDADLVAATVIGGEVVHCAPA
ncbi:MAG TPA: amidohydrolase family protein [Acidimicrobiales bacterium]|nr:amidohydrolase family protein [Acidimicrobiales bacterium]